MLARPLLAAALVLSACGSDDAVESDAALTPVPIVSGVGELPEAVPDTASVTTSSEAPVGAAPVIDEDTAALDALIAESVEGNRLLVIGDSIMASTATRFGREMCDALNPLGWDVEIDAEPGRFVDFGLSVLERVLPDEPDGDPEDDWSAAIVHLGSNYRGDQNEFFEALTEILSRLEPRPTLLFTVTEYRPSWSEANAVIRELAEVFENVTLLDWEQAARTPGVLSSDGLHPTDSGEEVLVGLVAAALGAIAGSIEGECLPSSFTDDSAIGLGGGTPNGSSSSTGGSGSSSGSSGGSGSSSGSTSTGGSSNTTTTVDTSDPTTTTTSPGSTTTGGSTTGGTTGGSGGATTTSPPATDPPPTDPPATSPPTTDPPATSPPTTDPPATLPPPTIVGP